MHEHLTDALSCVLLLRPSRMATDLLEDAEVRYRYRLVRVYELDAAPVVATPIVSLLPFVPVMRGGVELTDTAERLVYESPLPRSDKADMLIGMAFLAGLVSNASYRQLEKRVLALTEPERLRGLLRTAILANDVAEFERALAG